MPWPGFEPGEWDPQSHVLSKLHHQGRKQMKNSLKLKKINSLNLSPFEKFMMATGEMATDVGTILYGKEAVASGLIDKLGGLSDALDALHKMINKKSNQKRNLSWLK